jgi:hypothetical protein
MPMNESDSPKTPAPLKSAESIRTMLADRDLTEADIVPAIAWARANPASSPFAPYNSVEES